MTPEEISLAAEATLMHQSTKWGMRTFQSSFPRVKDRIEFESIGQWKQMMKLMILLFNLRARQVGINQSLNVYMPALIMDVNEIYGWKLIIIVYFLKYYNCLINKNYYDSQNIVINWFYFLRYQFTNILKNKNKLKIH